MVEAGKGRGEVLKQAKGAKYKGKIEWKKIHARQWTLKHTHAKAQKKKNTRKTITKTKSCGSKIPHPPNNFSNGPSLNILIDSLSKAGGGGVLMQEHVSPERLDVQSIFTSDFN